MKTILKRLGIAGAISLGWLGCENDDSIYNTSVYTSRDTSQVYSLYVDDELYGLVPTLASPISCDSTARLADCLNFTLPAGRHKLELWDEAGAVVSGFRLKVDQNATKVSSIAGINDGGAFVAGNGTCIVVRMD
jgi:hypothetical protein